MIVYGLNLSHHLPYDLKNTKFYLSKELAIKVLKEKVDRMKAPTKLGESPGSKLLIQIDTEDEFHFLYDWQLGTMSHGTHWKIREIEVLP